MRPRFYVLAAVLTTACHAPASAPPPTDANPACGPLPERVEVIPVEKPYPGELNEVFDFPDESSWWAPAPMDPAQAKYRAALVARLGEAALAPRVLLERARKDHAAMTDANGAREAENMTRALEGTGTIGPISCLEWRLFQHQDARYPMLEHPTELGAYVLRGEGRIRVYLSGGDLAGGKLRHEVKDRVRADVGRGFVALAHLHNHNFMFDRKPGDRMWTTEATVHFVGGTVAPSLTDVHAYRGMREELGLRGAWVTNGLDTGRFEAEDFDRLSAWE
ncbi:hypothetical protein [Polyangium aurulentum]|uniref:hypothetical protein n=1 Tax=Polyangium aurulentum TaxID=2567896 RepID=UPI0010AED184|nr:hypothetical protein [Polyangium aurulentum]UQA62660.1 hypothetical protein E8A73_020275 [Polyangium aurulentum]